MKVRLLIMCLCLIHTLLFSLKPVKEYLYHPSQVGLMVKELTAITTDSLNIKVWYFPAQKQFTNEEFSEYVQKGEKRPYNPQSLPRTTLIISDGDSANMSYVFNHVLALTNLGFNVVTFDWRGFGESSEWKTETDYLVYAEYLLDYNAVVDLVYQQPETDQDRIILYGGSTGAYLSYATAYKNTKVKGFIGRALLTSFDETIPILKKLKPERNLIVPDNYPVELMPINIVEKMNKPSFFIVGENDIITPVAMSQLIYEKTKNPIKDIWIVKNAEHGGEKGPEYLDHQAFIHKMEYFLNQFK